MGFTPATGTEISMGCVYGAFGLTPIPGSNIGLNSTLGVNRQPPQALGVSSISVNTETDLSADMGGLETIEVYCGPQPGCNVYEYINTTQNTTFTFGPYALCPGPGDFDIQIAPGAEGVTFCIEQLSQGTIDAFNAQGLTLSEGECYTPPIPTTVVNCGTTYTSALFEQEFRELFRVPLGTGTGTSSYVLDVAPAIGAGTTGAIRFVVTYNDVTVQDTGWVSRDSNANSVYLTGLNNLLTALGYPTVASITVITSPSGITGSFSKNVSSVQNAFVEVFIYTPSGSTGNPFALRINCVV